MKKIAACFIALVLAISFIAGIADARVIRPQDITVPSGYSIDSVVEGLSAPTMVTFDVKRRMLIAESGYDGSGDAKITRIEKNGQKTRLTKKGVFGSEVPLTAIAVHNNILYAVHAGTISIVNPNGTLKDIITGLPGQGDHQANQLVFKDNKLYFAIGTVTNSGVVGPDDAVLGWLRNPQYRQLHDVPCKDISVNSVSFSAKGVDNSNEDTQTSPYAVFGDTSTSGQTVPGNVKCNGAILQANLDGSNLEVYAWGFRNPYGLEVGPDKSLYVTMHGFDARGSRPIENAWDCFYKVQEGAWYGWPDFACDVPVTDGRFKVTGKTQPDFILANHPTEQPPKPIAKFGPHDAINGFAFAPSEKWGKPTDAYIALFGDLTPATGTVSRPAGIQIVKLDTITGKKIVFISNTVPGQASKHSAGGFEHPSDVTFGPDGNMYITDWGVANVSSKGILLEKNSGVVWRVSHSKRIALSFLSPSFWLGIISIILFGYIAYFFMKGERPTHTAQNGWLAGAVAGIVFSTLAVIVAITVFHLPWYAPVRVFGTLGMGRTALTNILEFHWLPFIIGVTVIFVVMIFLGGFYTFSLRQREKQNVVLGGLFYGLTVWAATQYLIFPLVDPLIVEKGFTPFWYAVLYGVYGLTLGILVDYLPQVLPELTINTSSKNTSYSIPSQTSKRVKKRRRTSQR